MKFRTFALLGAVTLFATLAMTVQTLAQKTEGQFITFDVPGADHPFGGTAPRSINPRGEITGDYGDVNGSHAFVRAADGTITTFDAGPHAIYTTPISINPAGTITGYVINANESGVHAFVRAFCALEQRLPAASQVDDVL